MTRITRIARLSKCGVFRDFEWPEDLPDLARYNLIYGWNGSGKTTLSRILRSLEKRIPPASGKVTVALDHGGLEGKEFRDVHVPIRVFNRDFIVESVFPIGGGELPPILVLGTESIQKQKEIERLRKLREKAESRYKAALYAKRLAEQAFESMCIQKAKEIKATLRSAEEHSYTNYNKADFKRDADELAKAGAGPVSRLTDIEYETLKRRCDAKPKDKLQEVTYTLPNLEAVHTEVAQVLKVTVVARCIEALKTDSELAEWIRRGLRLHGLRSVERCLFCEQTLPTSRLAILEDHFNDAYESVMERLNGLIIRLEELSRLTSQLRLPNKAELYEELGGEYQTREAQLKQSVNVVSAFLKKSVLALEEKRNRAFESVNLDIVTPQLDVEAVAALNAVIRRHNQTCDDFAGRVTEARKKVASHVIASALDEYISKRNRLNQSERELQDTRAEIDELNSRIEQLEREIVEHRRPADELNRDLYNYLGHDELRLEVKDTGYTITRGGRPAETLSEGEITAVALLYFLKSLRDRNFDLANGIVVLDDPVSSLDANALYLAFSFIREHTKDAAQLIILTHNFAFFRQVRNWFSHLKGQRSKDPDRQPARFYMLDCGYRQAARCSVIRPLDRLLEHYNSEYHYLFSYIYQAVHATSPTTRDEDMTGLAKNYVLPNMARRMLEAFLAFRNPDISGTLEEKIDSVVYDNAKKARILRFLHTYSHADAIADPGHDLSLLAETKLVLTDLLEFVKVQDRQHYEAMIRTVEPPVGEDT